MAIYEVVLRQRYYNQDCVNRWNYSTGGIPASVSGSFGLVSALGAISLNIITLLGKLRELQNASVDFVDIEAREIWSQTDFYNTPFPAGTVGTQPGEPVSPAMAYGFRTNRVRRDVRRATKRFAGVVETATEGGGVITSSYQNLMQELATIMSTPLQYTDEGNIITYTPCVCGKLEYTTPKGTKAYKYYPDEATQLDHTAIGVAWEIYDTVRTQGSRQYGRGR